LIHQEASIALGISLLSMDTRHARDGCDVMATLRAVRKLQKAGYR